MTTNTKTGIDSFSVINYSKINLYTILETYSNTFDFTIVKYNKHKHNSTYIYKKNNKNIFRYSTGIVQGREFNILSFDGLCSYDTELDELRETTLFNILEYINYKLQLYLQWNIRQLDIFLDLNTTQNKIIVTRDKTRGLKLNKLPLRTDGTYYLEKVGMKNGKLNKTNMKLSSYLYNKTLKEKQKHNNIIDDITRFEISILRNKFKNIHTIDDIMDIVDYYKIYEYNNVTECIKDKKRYNTGKDIVNSDTVKFDKVQIKTFMEFVSCYTGVK